MRVNVSVGGCEHILSSFFFCVFLSLCKFPQQRAREEYEAKLAHLDARHEHILETVAVKLSLSFDEVRDAVIEGGQVSNWREHQDQTRRCPGGKM